MQRTNEDDEVAFRRTLNDPVSVHYSLGRPMAKVFALNFAEVEVHVSELLNLLAAHQGTGGVITVGGDWLSEGSLNAVLSFVATRLRGQGRTVAVCGSPFILEAAPPRPKSDVSILLEATAYRSIGAWSEVVPGQLTVLAGCCEKSDLPIRPARPSVIQSVSEPIVKELAETWLANRGEIIGDGLLLCAAGIDLPSDFFGSDRAPFPFVSVNLPDETRPTGWSSIPGAWLGRYQFRDQLRSRGLDRLARRISDHPGLACRLVQSFDAILAKFV